MEPFTNPIDTEAIPSHAALSFINATWRLAAVAHEIADSPTLQWNVGYAAFILWLYLFHAPFRTSSEERTQRARLEGYALLTRIAQVWCGVHITVFHFISPSKGTWLAEHDSSSQFFPLFSTWIGVFLFLHKAKRCVGMRLTYASTLLTTQLNALLVAILSTVHTTYCAHLLFDPNKSDDSLRSRWYTIETGADYPGGNATKALASLRPLDFASYLVTHPTVAAQGTAYGLCPNPSTPLGPSGEFIHLLILGVIFLLCDYAYKLHWRNDHLRGVLWAAPVHDKVGPNTDRTPGGEAMVTWYSMIASKTALQLFLKLTLAFLTLDFRETEVNFGPKHFRFRQWGRGKYDDEEEGMASPAAGKSRSPVSSPEPSGQPVGKPKASRSTSQQSTRPPSPATSPTISMPSGPVSFWFDWVADVGDGFDSTYAIAHLMASPELKVRQRVTERRIERLKRTLRSMRENAVGSPGVLLRRLSTNFLLRKDAPAKKKGSMQASPAATPVASRKEQQTAAKKTSSIIQLPRGQFVLVGGDLAYPDPTEHSYQRRFFHPYSAALPKHSSLRQHFTDYVHDIFGGRGASVGGKATFDDDITVVDTIHQPDAARYANAEGLPPPPPAMFSIPGNHDWIDGAQTYRTQILGKSWLGGWIMPQRSSYFVLELPGNWWIFACDSGFHEDLDISQLHYFMSVIDRRLDERSSVILAVHEPMWLHDMHYRPGEPHTMVNVQKVARRLGERLRLRICGDIHNYSRHEPTVVEGTHATGGGCPTLIVSGGGGAFMHGLHGFKNLTYHGVNYEQAATFPLKRRRNLLGLASHIWKFRFVNWQFDFIGGLLYLVMCSSLLPLPVPKDIPVGQGIVAFLLDIGCHTIAAANSIVSTSYISAGTIAAVILLHGFSTEKSKMGTWKRVLFGIMWGSIHAFIAVYLMVLLHHMAALFSVWGMVASTSTEWNSSLEQRVVSASQVILEELTRLPRGLGVMFSQLKSLLITLDVPNWLPIRLFRWSMASVDGIEGFVYLQHRVSVPDTFGVWAPTATRWECIQYVAHTIWFYWLLATPMVSLVVGVWVVISLVVFDVGYDNAYAAFCIEDFKNFLRFWLSTDEETGEVVLNGFVVGVEKVPKVWEANPNAKPEASVPSHCQPSPQTWRPWKRTLGKGSKRSGGAPKGADPTAPTLVDQFEIRPTPVREGSDAGKETTPPSSDDDMMISPERTRSFHGVPGGI